MSSPEPLAAESPSPGMSWGSAIAGAVAAAELSLLLLVLGVGLGLTGASPWSGSGMSAKALGVSAIVWLAFTQIAASGLGGYLAGRLRTRWVRLHTDEVYFRDTAHGLVAWSLATVAMAALMGSATSNVIGAGVTAGTTVGASAGAVAAQAVTRSTDNKDASTSPDLTGYWVDALLRPDPLATPGTTVPASESSAAVRRAETTRIMVHGLADGRLSSTDLTYLGQVVALQTGMTPAAAQQRVQEVFANMKKSMDDAAIAAKDAADKARKTAAYSSLWMFVALLAGAFVAAVAATLGGRQRDRAVMYEA